MKTFFKLLLFIIFIPIVPVFLFFLSINQERVSAGSIKTSLVNTGVYTKVFDELDKQAEKMLSDGGQGTEQMNVIWPMIKSEINPAYIQNKTETFIDDTSLWLDDKSKNPPVLSFADLKTSLLNKNPELLTVLNELSTELKKGKEEAKQQAIDNGQTTEEVNEQVPDFDFQKIIKSDFSIPVGEKMGALKNIYSIQKYALPVLILIMAVLAAGVVLLSGNLKSILKWLGTLLFLSAMWSMVVFLAISGASKFFLSYTTQQIKDLPSFVLPLLTGIANPIWTSFVFFEKSGFITLVVVSIVCIAAGNYIPEKTIAAKSITKPRTNRK